MLKDYTGNKKGQAYACINKDENIRLGSSSGGIFALIADVVLQRGGVVFGAVFDDELNVHHIAIDNSEDLKLLQGSKYLQSRIGDAYALTKKYLEAERIVLFSGTPCQISGLKSFLKKDYDNLILQDIICHGVPSPFVWQQYLKYQEKKSGKQVAKNVLPNFRKKSDSWKRYLLSIKFVDGEEYKNVAGKDIYIKAFLNNLSLRPSCYNCNLKSVERESDITLADFWGVENIAPEMFDDKGTSLVFINSDKGRRVFDKISDKMIFKEVDIDEAIKFNPSAIKSVEYPKKRDKFFELVAKTDFDKAVKRCIGSNFIIKCKSKIKILIKRMCNYVQK